MKVICFKGVSNSGKSKTIKKILQEFFKIITYPNKKDFKLSFEWEGKKVLLCSGGDALKWMKPIFQEIDPRDYNLFICACHPRNDVFKKLVEVFNEEELNFIDCRKEEESDEEYNRRISEFKQIFL